MTPTFVDVKRACQMKCLTKNFVHWARGNTNLQLLNSLLVCMLRGSLVEVCIKAFEMPRVTLGKILNLELL